MNDSIVQALREVMQQDEKSIVGRMELKNCQQCLLVRFFIKNATQDEIVLISGVGGVIREVVPDFYIYGLHSAPAKWQSWLRRRSMRPETVRLKAYEEILYDTYVLAVPPKTLFSPKGRLSAIVSFAAAGKAEITYHVRSEATDML